MALAEADGGAAVASTYPVRDLRGDAAEAVRRETVADPPMLGDEEDGWGLPRRLHLSRMFLAALKERAAQSVHRSDLDLSGAADDDGRYRAMARMLGLPYVASIDPDALIVRDRDLDAVFRSRSQQAAMVDGGDGASAILVAPDEADLPKLQHLLSEKPAMAQRLRIVSARALREAFIDRAGPHLLRNARDGLFDRFPELSARIVLNAWQGSVLGAGIVLLPAALMTAPGATMLVMHAFFSMLFFSCVFLRLAAIRRGNRMRLAPLERVHEADLPVYTVLVALYREAEVVPDLLVALGRIVWPRGKLEIKLVCEADDDAALGALATQTLRPSIEIVRVPTGGPRTKPKALAYALQLSSGEFVALYDAEDRPHPLQLIEAWQRFSRSGPDLACVQAPLVISNWNGGMLPRMFAFEYAALFRGLLPWLSRRKLMFPLGGTSNHFRRQALDHVGGWDAYNVTEDADLGLKLSRFGYRCETITRPTFEDAPDDLGVWTRQRTRWFKGWIQTWLVHMRDPAQLARELGLGSFLVAQILFAGMVASALVHPLILFMLVGVVTKIGWAGAVTEIEAALLAIDALNIIFGYLAFLALGMSTLTPVERRGLARIALWTPIYRLLMSVAAWRSVWQLYWRPHLWEKTPHRPHRAVMAAAVDPPSGRA
jgi:cellulose synthase/poly-beta-1,6-N-acetylglucosamine synthase-like glycosyltransferase